MSHIIEFLTSLIIAVINKSGYWGIFGLMSAESALIPIPSEITMTFAGYIVSMGRLNLWVVICVGALANLFGSLLAYALGYWGEDHVVRSLIRKYGKFLLIDEGEYDQSEKWFKKYGEGIVFFSRLLPVVRTFISLPAGIAKMNMVRFIIFTIVGSFLWSGLLTYVGYALGKNWNSLHVYYQKFEFVIIGALVVAGIYYIYHKLHKLAKKGK